MPGSRGSSEIRDAIAELYQTQYERVARYIYARIGNMHEAEDLASEVFTRALRSSHKYTAQGPPLETWIIRIAHNIVVDHLRKRTRRPESVELDEALRKPTSLGDPTESAERRDELGTLNDAMAGISEAQRRVLQLRFGAEMTSEQAAKALGKKPGAVREMQSAAIKKLRELLKENMDSKEA
ncbi:MAG: sigma-70 family RNA polymerase sigma factor [Chloroflexi bacterium]|nr:sigma-70 family RNA polymerase sigma factor [Chloroflexota bacterium]